MGDLYDSATLALKKDEMPQFRHAAFDKAARAVYERGEFSPAMLRDERVRGLIDETNRVLSSALTVSHETPPELTAALRNNVFIFSGLKTYHSLSEVGLSLTDEEGNTKSFADFHRDVKAIDARYNSNYLYAEYNHAVHSAQMAVKWYDWEKDGDEYDLQYRTAGDERVRLAHRQLDGVTLPPGDKFWDRYLPPNGWNCRCNVVQVLHGDYPRSDSDAVTVIGDEYTRDLKAQMFRFNAGKTLTIYPKKHPYYKAPAKAKQIVEQMSAELRTQQQVVEFMNASEERRAWFERGFKALRKETNPRNNGSTDCAGTIWMNKDRLKHVLSGLTKLRQQSEISFDEADALATFWHEITHNRNKRGNINMTALQIQYMELANEFVARKTLPEFYKAVGGKMQHPEFMNNRSSTGYNRWVRNYCKAIERTGADADKVLEAVREHLFTQSYDDQKNGLINALLQGGAHTSSGTKIGKRTCSEIVRESLWYSEEGFEKYLESLIR